MLEVKNITFSYEENKPVLQELSMNFETGHVYGVLGANGSGKSTLFLSLVGILKPQKGTIYYDKQALNYHKKNLMEYRQKVGIVFQNPDQQIFYSIVKDDVAFALHNLGYPSDEILKRVDHSLEQLGIMHLKEKPIHYLSYGQKKRVAIAGALALETDWLLLDEPTAGLDPDGKNRMVDVIQTLVAQGKNIILSSHDMDLMYSICDYFYIMKQGKILTKGLKQDIFSDAKLLEGAKLEQPWLVKVQQHFDLPFCENEKEFFSQKNEKKM